MQIPVDLIERARVRVGTMNAFKDDFHLLDLDFRSMLRGKPGRNALHLLSQQIEFRDCEAIRFRNHRTPLRLDCDTAFGLQPAHGFAHRPAADPQPLGNGGFLDSLTGMELSLADVFEKLPVDPFGQRKVGAFF